MASHRRVFRTLLVAAIARGPKPKPKRHREGLSREEAAMRGISFQGIDPSFPAGGILPGDGGGGAVLLGTVEAGQVQ